MNLNKDVDKLFASAHYDFGEGFTSTLMKQLSEQKYEARIWDLSSIWMVRAVAAAVLFFGVYAAWQYQQGSADALLGTEDLSFYDWTLLEELQ
jgi:hypothetical protein